MFSGQKSECAARGKAADSEALHPIRQSYGSKMPSRQKRRNGFPPVKPHRIRNADSSKSLIRSAQKEPRQGSKCQGAEKAFQAAEDQFQRVLYLTNNMRQA